MNPKIKKSFLFNLGIVALVALFLYICFFATLHWLTRHGEEKVIPDVRGLLLGKAVEELRALEYDVVVDSIYETAYKPLTVLKQVPDSGSIVKHGRTVFLTVNMLTPPHIPMPNLVSLSYRSAEMLLRNNKLLMGDTTHVPDIAGGAVKEQLYKNKVIKPGEMIPQGSKISLVIGDGLGNTQFDVPEITGMSVEEASMVLAQYNLVVLLEVYDQMSEIADTQTAIIVEQVPCSVNQAGGVNRIKEGDFIELKILQKPSAEEIHKCNTNGGSRVN